MEKMSFFMSKEIFVLNFYKKYLTKLFKALLSQKFRTRSANGKMELNGLQRDHLSAKAIS